MVVVDHGSTGVALVAEAEPNDEPGAAQRLSVPGGVRGVIDRAGDQDGYVVEVAAPGTLSARLSPVEDADLVLDLHDGAGKKLLVSDNGPAKTAEGFPNVVLQPGTYRLVVREFVKKPKGRQATAAAGRTAPSRPYELELALRPLPGPGEEAEPNDQAAFAGTVAIGGAASGWIGWRKDRDVWKVPLEGAGDDMALAVDVDGVADVALTVAVLDGTEAVLLERKGRAGEALALRNVAIRPGEPHYYVVVSTSGRGHLDERYELRLSSAPFQLDEEEEPNDTIAAPGALADVPDADSGTRVGYLGRGDVDVYRLEPSEAPRRLHVTAEPPPGIDVELAVLGADGRPLVPPADAGKRGAAEKLASVPIPAGAAAFVRLSLKSGDGMSDRYRLRWSAVIADEAPPPPGLDEP